MHYKTKILLAVGAVLLLMMVSFTAGVAVTNPFVYLMFSENAQFFVISFLTLVIAGLVVALWQHKFSPVFSGFALAIVLTSVIFCLLVILTVISDLINGFTMHSY